MKAKLRKISRFLFPLLIAVAIPILLARCTPQWFPDSKRIVYTAPGGVTLYNVDTRESKRITPLKSPIAGVGVWPTGDRVAVVHFPAPNRKQVQISVFDLEGSQNHTSELFEPKQLASGGKNFLTFLQTYVSPNGKHLVVFWPGDAGALTYDFETKDFHTYPKLFPIGLFAGMAAAGMIDEKRETMSLGFNASPVTPDSSGFVAIVGDAEPAGFAFIPWGKKPIQLEFPAEQRKRIEDKSQQGKGNSGLATIPRWINGKLVMYFQGSALSIDPKSQACSFEADMRSDGLLQHAQKHHVTVVGELHMGTILQLDGQSLQIWRRGSEPVTIFKPSKEGGILGMSISPDRRKVLLRQLADEKDTIHIYDAQGRELAELKHASFLP